MRDTWIEEFYVNFIRMPDKLAVIADDGIITYKELWQKTLSFSNYLKEQEICQSDIIILKAMHSLNFVIAELAVNLLGATVALVEKDLKDIGVKNIADELLAKYIISDENVEGYPFCELSAVYKISKKEVNEDFTFPNKESCAEIIYTTGTTGQSKGVQLSHESVMSVIENIMVADQIQTDNVALVPMPLNHVFGLRRYQANLCSNATVVLQDCLMPIKRFFKVLDTYHVTSLSLVPSAISYIFAISKNMLGKYKEQIRYVESSAAPLPMESKRKLHELLPASKLLSFYGCTECTAACVLEYSTYMEKDRCAGVPTKNAKVYVIDETTGNKITTAGIEGRVVFKSTSNMMGYWNNPQITQSVLCDGYVYTNDEGYFDEQGFLYLLGRKDDVINVGGNKIAPDELEDILNNLPEIEDCACIGLPNQVTGEELVLCVKTNLSHEQLAEPLRKHLSKQVENYKIPSRIEIVEEIPRTYNGKLQRGKLREQFMK